MTVAFLSSQRSKDPNKQVGAVIASEENLILGALDFESRMSSLDALVVASRYFFSFFSLSLVDEVLSFSLSVCVCVCVLRNRCGIQRVSSRVRRRRVTLGEEESHGQSPGNEIRVRVPRGDERHHEQKFRGREERNHVRDHVSMQRVRKVDDTSRDQRGGVLRRETKKR